MPVGVRARRTIAPGLQASQRRQADPGHLAVAQAQAPLLPQDLSDLTHRQSLGGQASPCGADGLSASPTAQRRYALAIPRSPWATPVIAMADFRDPDDHDAPI